MNTTQLRIRKILFISIPVVFFFCLIINYLTTEVGFGKYFVTIRNVSNYFDTPITPMSWSFIIWSVIYTWQTGINLFLLASFIIMVAGMRLYEYPFIFSNWFLVSYLLNFVFNIAWLFMFNFSIYSLNLLPTAVFFILATSVSLYLAIFYAYRGFKTGSEDGFYKDNYLLSLHMRILVHNGLNAYAAWTTIAQFVLFTASLAYLDKLSLTTASLISLSILLVIILVYYILDLIRWDQYTRYVLTPHLVWAWAFTAIVFKNFHLGGSVSILSLVLWVLSMIMLIAKVAVTIVRYRKSQREGYEEFTEARRIL